MAQLGGSSFVISPGHGTWELETRAGAVMDGARRRARARGDPRARAVLRRARRPELRGGQGPRRGPVRLGDAHDGGPLSGPVREPRVRDHAPVPVARRLEDARRPRRAGAPGTIRSVVGVASQAAAVRGSVVDAAHGGAAGDGRRRPAARRATSCRARSWSAPPRSRARRAAGSRSPRRRAPRWTAPTCSTPSRGALPRRTDARPRRPRCAARSATGACASPGSRAPLPGARFMHCLPVRRNVKVADEVLDGPRSVVVRQAANRLHVQKAVLHRCSAASESRLTPADAARLEGKLMTTHDRNLDSRRAQARAPLHPALPRASVFVVKVGGALCGDPARLAGPRAGSSASSVSSGSAWCSCTAAAPQTTALSSTLGIETQFVEGRRITDKKTLEVAVMTMNGTINTAILAACRAAELPAIGISGIDAGLIRARRRPPRTHISGDERRTIDYGEVGDVVAVDVSVLNRFLDAGFVPVVSPLVADDAGAILNMNADTVASTLARELAAEKLMFVQEAPGILEDKRRPVVPRLVHGRPRPQRPPRARRARRRHDPEGQRRQGRALRRRQARPRHRRGRRQPAARSLHQRGRGHAHRDGHARPAARRDAEPGHRTWTRSSSRRKARRSERRPSSSSFHREIVAIPSVSHREKALCDFLETWLARRGVAPIRIGNNVCALAGEAGPILALNSHFDTVDANTGLDDAAARAPRRGRQGPRARLATTPRLRSPR